MAGHAPSSSAQTLHNRPTHSQALFLEKPYKKGWGALPSFLSRVTRAVGHTLPTCHICTREHHTTEPRHMGLVYTPLRGQVTPGLPSPVGSELPACTSLRLPEPWVRQTLMPRSLPPMTQAWSPLSPSVPGTAWPKQGSRRPESPSVCCSLLGPTAPRFSGDNAWFLSGSQVDP